MAASMTLPAKAQESEQIDIAPTSCEKEIEEPQFFGMIVESAAIPMGGMDKFFKAINAELKYPKGFTGSGKVFVGFVVDTLGRISDVKVLKGFTEWADKEAVRVLTTLNYPFTPGRQRGKAVRVQMVLPVVFNKL